MKLANQKMELLKKLTLLTDEHGSSGYDTEQIRKVMGDELYASFQRWFAGKTGIIIDGKYCVFPDDLELYLKLRDQAVKKNNL